MMGALFDYVSTAALQAAGWVLLYLYLFWLLYVLIMGFYRAWLSGKLKGIAFVLALPALIVGYMLDLVANWTIAAVWFEEWPRKPLELVTDRLTRYIEAPDSPDVAMKKAWAKWVCSTLLDYFDPFKTHCTSVQGTFKPE